MQGQEEIIVDWDFRFNGTLNTGIGTWTKVSGPGTVIFSPDANTANALATVSSYGTYTFSWTVANGTCSNSSSVNVVFIQQAAANAGLGGNDVIKTSHLVLLFQQRNRNLDQNSGPGNARLPLIIIKQMQKSLLTSLAHTILHGQL